MKTLMNQRTILAVLAAAAATLLWPALRVKAFTPQPDPPAFGMIGIDAFATLRVNALCAEGPLPLDVPPGPCNVTLEFHDITGRVLKQMTKTLAPGEGTFLDLRGSDMPLTGRHMELAPCIRPVGLGFVLGDRKSVV